MPWVKPTNQRHIFVRIRGDNHDNRDYTVDNNRCMNSGYRPSLVVSRKAPESCLTLPDGFSVGFSGWSRDYYVTCSKNKLVLDLTLVDFK